MNTLTLPKNSADLIDYFFSDEIDESSQTEVVNKEAEEIQTLTIYKMLPLPGKVEDTETYYKIFVQLPEAAENPKVEIKETTDKQKFLIIQADEKNIKYERHYIVPINVQPEKLETVINKDNMIEVMVPKMKLEEISNEKSSCKADELD